MYPPSRSLSLALPLLNGLVTVLATACSSSTPTGTGSNLPAAPTATAADITIVPGASAMTTGAFNPDTKTVALNGGASVEVRWVNRDISSGGAYGGSAAVTHHIVSDDGKSFDTGNLNGNEASTKALSVAGTYTYHCAIHPNMVGTVVVNP